MSTVGFRFARPFSSGCHFVIFGTKFEEASLKKNAKTGTL